MFTSDRVALSENGRPQAGERRSRSRPTVENRLPPGRYTIASDIYTGEETPAGPTKMIRLEIAGAAAAAPRCRSTTR